MTITVKYFASLRERMGRAEDRLEGRDGVTVLDIWSDVSGGGEMDENILCAVNLEYVPRSETVADGDEVAFFPPVTGG